MAYLTNLQSSTLSNQNITSALLLATYTNTTRLRKIYIDVFADQIAGNGDYVVYATRQRSGSGSAYEVGARTTVAVPSGVTSQAFPTIALTCGATDVIKVYLVGLAGDTTTPDTIVDFSEEFINVDSSGNPTSNDSSGITTLLMRVVGTLLAGNHNPQSGDAYARLGAPSGASVSADIAALPSASTIATAVWAAATRTLTGFGTLVADVWSYATRTITGGGGSAADIWAYATRTLTQSAASVISAVNGSDITAYRGTTWSIALTGLGNITGYTNLWFAIKQSSTYNTDNESIVLIGVSSGLTRINGAAYVTTSDGSITINDATAGDITITLKPAASSLLKVQSDLDYGIKWINASGNEYQLSDGTQKFNIAADNPRAIS